MFKSYKLNKYKDSMIDIAYDFGKPKDGAVVINFYIVICEKDRYKFVYLDSEKGNNTDEIQIFIKDYNARPIKEYASYNISKNRNDKVKKLV